MFEGLLNKVEISEAAIYGISSRLLETLLIDRTTGENILWCTDDYIERGEGYTAKNHITVEQVISEEIIQSRIFKSLEAQKNRVKEKGEVFTPAWLCNLMNNAIDDEWLGYKEAFSSSEQGNWTVNKEKIKFPQQGKTQPKGWQGYVKSRRLELTCGEAPFLVSRYDMADGRMIPVNERIGLLDRKLRVINEHIRNLRAKRENAKENWLSWAMKAVRNTYGYEWQGDNVLLARENILLDVMEFYEGRWQEEMPIDWVHKFAEVISWNIWQMDGLKLVVPGTCHEEIIEKQIQSMTLFEKEKITAKDIKCQENFLKNDETVTVQNCPGCRNEDISMHNGIPCKIKNWSTGEVIEFRSCLCEYWEGAEKMGKKPFRPDVIIGNPPYQVSDGGAGKSAKPVYQHFVSQAKKFAPNIVSLIIPSRWFAGGKGLDDFRRDMLTDKHIKILVDFENFRDVFPGVDLAGGACFFIRDNNYDGDCKVVNATSSGTLEMYRNLDEFDILVRSNKALEILRKVIAWNKTGKTLSSVVSSRKPFGLPTNYGAIENGVPCWFIQRIGRKFADPKDVDDSMGYLSKWKLLAPKAPIAGQTDFSKPVGFYYDGNTIIAAPGECCTESFIVLGAFDTEKEVNFYRSYIFTRTVRFLLLQSVVSQDVTKKNFCFVPDLGKYDKVYTDAELCSLWGITEDEWLYIESKIGYGYERVDS